MTNENDRALTTLVDTITVKQDVGTMYPVYKGVTLYLWSDGTVDWKPAEGVTLD